MRLYNTLSHQIEPLQPIGDAVTLYVCGITPYDTTHLGHAFINVVYDTLVRALRWQGQPVTYVQNVTDIDDDILRKAREVKLEWCELGQRETDRYLDDLRALNVEMPTHFVRASDEIARMVELIAGLIARGHAYVRDGWVYFSVKSDPGFGQLAEAAGYHGYQAWLATANERGNFPADPRKHDPLDFVLWQAQQDGEPSWESPWSAGRPGWHIECSSMATTYLGQRIDIHGGGADLIFPHHTCEIAQSENATGARPFVKIWMHCGMVRLDGEKMSKSLGNLVLVRDLLRAHSGGAIRAMLLGHHYREEWEYQTTEMRRADALMGKLLSARRLTTSQNNPDAEATRADEVAQRAQADFTAALDDDLDTPRALRVLEALADAALSSGAEGQLSMLMQLAGVLGLSVAPTISTGTSAAISGASATAER